MSDDKTGGRERTGFIKKNLIRVLQGERVTPPPVWLMRQAGRYLPEYRRLRAGHEDFVAFCLDAKSAARATLQPLDRFSLDAAIIFSDILLVPWALGTSLRFDEGKGPLLSSLARHGRVPRFDEKAFHLRLQPVLETIGIVKERLAPHQALIGFAGAPWTLAAYMIEGEGSRDFTKARLWALKEPERFHALMEALEEAVACHLIAQLRAGADCVQIFDSWAGCLDDSCFKEWVVEATSRVVAKVRQQFPDALIIGFARGGGARLIEYARKSGVDALSLDHGVAPAWASANLQVLRPLQGNLDPVILCQGGATLKRRALDIIAAFGSGGHIFNLGHGVLPTTPPQRVEELLRIVRSAGR